MLIIEADVSATTNLLDDMVQRLENPRGILTVLGRELEEYERELFATNGRGQWAPDDPDTVEQKGSARVLVDTGGLLDQMTNAHIDGESVYVNAGSAYYARFLKDGDRGMPVRDAALLPPSSTIEHWGEQLLDYLVGGLA